VVMKRIFVVDGGAELHRDVEVSEKDWAQGCFSAKIQTEGHSQPIFGVRSDSDKPGYPKITTYVGFEAEEKAVEFAAALRKRQEQWFRNCLG